MAKTAEQKAPASARVETPATPEQAAELMRTLGGAGQSLRVRGAGTKWNWGAPVETEAIVSTSRLCHVVEHNAQDMTAVVQAGLRLGELQEIVGGAGQMLAVDPPLGDEDVATVGGIVATGDSGPLRQRYKAIRDLVLGMTVALPDGTLAHSGGKVIKNVAGYDLSKLFCGSFGTLGLVVEVVVRLHPRPARTLTLRGETSDVHALQRAALALGNARLEIEALDVAWEADSGSISAQFGGVAPEGQAENVRPVMEEHGLELSDVDDDAELWRAHRAAQRSADGVVVKVSALQTDLAEVVGVARGLGASVVGRAGLGIFYLRFEGERFGEVDDRAGAIEQLRKRLAPHSCVVLDADEGTRARVPVWGDTISPGVVEVMKSIKARFDPNGVCAPGLHAGGI